MSLAPIRAGCLLKFIRNFHKEFSGTFPPPQDDRLATSDESPSGGGIYDDPDTKLPHSLQGSNEVVFNVQGDGQVLDLDGGDGVNRRVQKVNLPSSRTDEISIVRWNHHSLDEFCRLSDGVLDRECWVSTVKVVQVNLILWPRPISAARKVPLRFRVFLNLHYQTEGEGCEYGGELWQMYHTTLQLDPCRLHERRRCPKGTLGFVNGIKNPRYERGQPAARRMDDINVGDLRTFLVFASRTVGNRKTHTIISGGVEGLITEGSVWKGMLAESTKASMLRTEQRRVVLLKWIRSLTSECVHAKRR